MADNDNDGWSTVPTKQKTSSSSSSTNKSQRTRKQKQQQRHHEEYDVVIAPTAATTSNTSIETHYKSPFMVLCVGLPGSGKSTFSRSLMKSNPTKFGRINQDELKTRQKCERKVKQMLLLSTSTSTSTSTSSESSSPQSIQQQQQQRLCPIIDRCNFDLTQRSTWYRLAEECGAADVDGGTTIPVDVVVFDIPYEVCLRRCEIRKGHETITSPKQAAGILQQLKSQWKPPSSNNSNSNNNNNSDEQKRYRSLTIIRTEQEQKERLIRILNQPS
jgi:predicted kinase